MMSAASLNRTGIGSIYVAVSHRAEAVAHCQAPPTQAQQMRNTRKTVLSVEKAAEIRRLHAETGFGPVRLARLLGVGRGVTNNVLRGAWSES